MSRHDFTEAEFRERQTKVRQAVGEAGLDWLIVFHPVSIHWLIGAEAKSYQAFQCLPVSSEDRPLVMFTRESERCEFENDTLADDVVGWGGGEPEDPVEAFARLADRLGLRWARVGIEVPAYYLHPHHYVRLKELLGAALVGEPSNLVHDLKLVKSPAEIALIREAARIADDAMQACVATFREGQTELQVAGAVYHALLTAGSGLPASTINLVSGERLGSATARRRCARSSSAMAAMSNWERPTSATRRPLAASSASGRHPPASARFTTSSAPRAMR